MRYKVYHATHDYFSEFNHGFGEEPVALERLEETHVLLHEFEAESLGDLWNRLQRETWQPDQRQRALIIHHQTHTTFCAGDIAQDEDRNFWQCMAQGWHLLE